MTIRRDWVLDYTVDDVIRSQSADPVSIRARRPRLVEISERALEHGHELIEPAVLMKRLPVTKAQHNRVTLANGSHLTGPLITEHLGGAQDVVVMLCTIGNKLEARALAESETNLSYGFALDAVGSAATHSLSAAACNQVEHEASAVGLQTSLPLSPGMEGWDVDPGQREIFSIVDSEHLGVVVSPTLMMRPLKSLTVVIGIGADIASKGAICDYCTLRDTCRQRVA
ncbi:MAG: hypothetical protein BMS9Abin12_1555 [Acidimicrobiia bacterium]|nr:MAG: hypothetical protein BMS9Abin12_1555 [Acidimicrobiia bacterium]